MPTNTPKFAAGNLVKVILGPYTDYKGIVTEAAPAQGKVRVKLAVFGQKAQMMIDASSLMPVRKKQ